MLRKVASSPLAGARVVVTGGAGFLGRRVLAALERRGLDPPFVPRRRDHDLTDPSAVARLFRDSRPDVVIHLAAEVGGIGANQLNPGRYFYANMAMALHLIEEARRAGIRKFVQVGTICSYPKFAPVPFREESLWDGYPEETNAPYGVAKKAALVMLDGYRRQYGLASACVLPANLYGPGDNFDPTTSHVVPALIRKCVDAIERGERAIDCWGSGAASREFLHVDDAAEGVVRAAERIDEPVPINLGTGQEITIRDLAGEIATACGFAGSFRWDVTRPDGQPRRAVDATRARERDLRPPVEELARGLRQTAEWYRESRLGSGAPN